MAGVLALAAILVAVAGVLTLAAILCSFGWSFGCGCNLIKYNYKS